MSVSNVIPVLQDRGPYILTASVIMMVFATALVLMRLVSKWGITKRVNADDWLCVLAWVSEIAQMPCRATHKLIA